MQRVSFGVMARWQSRVVRLVFGIGMLLLSGILAGAEALKDIGPPTNYVTDLAGVLNDSTKSDLDALCRSVETQAKAQVFVVTLHRIDGDVDAQTFSTDLYHQWKIGEKGSDRGVLLLFSIDDHKRWITTGYGLEGILPDGKVGDIGREMVPDLQAANYDGAVRTGVNDVAQAIAQDAGITLQTAQQRPVQSRSRSSGGSSFWGVVIFLVLMFLLFCRVCSRGGLTVGGRGDGYGGGGFDGDGGFGGGGGFSGGGGGDSGGGGAGGGW